LAIASREIAMPHPSRRRPTPQLELFPQRTPPPPGSPSWTTLPEPTRQALTGLVTRMLLSHLDAAGEATGLEGGDDDL
jgi:hypothetical protein